MMVCSEDSTHPTQLIGQFPSFTKPETGVIKAIVEVPTN